MNTFIVIVSFVILACILLHNASFRIGIPVLLASVLLGLTFSSHGLIPIHVTEGGRLLMGNIGSIALIFIVFYVGFGTCWKTARPIAKEAVTLATAGTLVTAGLMGVFSHYLLGWNWVESLLLGSVIASTDASSVFSILRSRKLGLKNGMSSLLEVENGFNAPISYLLTVIMLSVLGAKDATAGHIIWMFIAQLSFGAVFGLCLSTVAIFLIRRVHFTIPGFNALFLVAVALLSYSLPTLVGGNGYLSAYIVGIVLGNQQFEGKKDMVRLFEAVNGLMQVIIFFMLGLLANPGQMRGCALPALATFLVLSLVARPLSVAAILSSFRNRHYDFRQQLLVAFCGTRGAATIAFAILAITGSVALENDIFNVVFFVVLISVVVQGTLLPWMAKRLNLIDHDVDVSKTFTDFSAISDIHFSEIRLQKGNPWCDKEIAGLNIPENIMLCFVTHPDGSFEHPADTTVLKEGDIVSVCVSGSSDFNNVAVKQHILDGNSKWVSIELKYFPEDYGRVLVVRRDDRIIIPQETTVLMAGDVLYLKWKDSP